MRNSVGARELRLRRRAAGRVCVCVRVAGVWQKDPEASQPELYEDMLEALGLSGLQRVTARLIEVGGPGGEGGRRERAAALVEEHTGLGGSSRCAWCVDQAQGMEIKVTSSAFTITFLTIVPFFRVSETIR